MTPGPSALAELVARARRLGESGGRRLLGITGPPGAGKSTLAAALARELPAVVVPMDGFHLSNTALERLRRLERKGAPDTFDAAAYCALLRRLRDDDGTIQAPAFDRGREQTIPGAITVARETPLVITEGNYLLLDDGPWAAVRALLDEVWFVDQDEVVRVERVVARHISYGWDPVAARIRATTGSDGANARLIRSGRGRADLVLAHGWLIG